MFYHSIMFENLEPISPYTSVPLICPVTNPHFSLLSNTSACKLRLFGNRTSSTFQTAQYFPTAILIALFHVEYNPSLSSIIMCLNHNLPSIFLEIISISLLFG